MAFCCTFDFGGPMMTAKENQMRTWQRKCLEAPRESGPNNEWPNKALARQGKGFFSPKQAVLIENNGHLHCSGSPVKSFQSLRMRLFSKWLRYAKIKLIEQRPCRGEKCLDMLCPPMFHSPWLQRKQNNEGQLLSNSIPLPEYEPVSWNQFENRYHIFEWLSAHL